MQGKEESISVKVQKRGGTFLSGKKYALRSRKKMKLIVHADPVRGTIWWGETSPSTILREEKKGGNRGTKGEEQQYTQFRSQWDPLAPRPERRKECRGQESRLREETRRGEISENEEKKGEGWLLIKQLGYHTGKRRGALQGLKSLGGGATSTEEKRTDIGVREERILFRRCGGGDKEVPY